MVWIDVVNYEDNYQINQNGDVRNKKTKKVLKPIKTKGRYVTLNLCKNGVFKTKYVHHLVAEAFLKHKPNGRSKVIDHIDRNKFNNSIENLRVVSFRENCANRSDKSTSKYTGVSWNKTANKWQAEIGFNRGKKNLGYFDSEMAAHKSYVEFLKTIKN